jgi:arylformamidase
MIRRPSPHLTAAAALLALTACADGAASTGAADTAASQPESTATDSSSTPPSTAADAPATTDGGVTADGDDSSAPVATCPAASQAPTTPETVAYNQVDGVAANLLSVDIYPLAPQCSPAPVLFWVHGGGWRLGDKTNRMSNKVALAARNGWVLVSVNYRLTTPDTDVKWPTHGNDVNDAVTFVLDHAADYGIDPTRVGVMGHSAGAHLASMVTVDPDYSRDRIGCLVANDTESYDLNAKLDSEEGQVKALVINAFGDDPATLADASPTLVLRDNSGPVADAIVITRGTATRQRLSNEFAAAMRDAGAQTQVVLADGFSHRDVNDVIGTDDPVVAQPVEAFLQQCLAAPG